MVTIKELSCKFINVWADNMQRIGITLSIISVLSILILSACSIQSQPTPESQVCVAQVSAKVQAPEPKDSSLLSEDQATQMAQDIARPKDSNSDDAANQPKRIVIGTDGIPTKVVVEGQTLEIDLKAVDPDGDSLTYTYTAPLDRYGKWQTKIGDAGTYFTTITANDGKSTSTQRIRIVVEKANRAPIVLIDDITAKEGETIRLAPKIIDHENDKVSLTYSGFMEQDTYTLSYNDAGSHEVKITADDGHNTVNEIVKITVENVNRQPVLGDLPDMVIKETETAKIKHYATDLDKDTLTYSFSKPFDASGEWKTSYTDAGEYPVTVTVSDGKLTDTKAFKLTVLNTNRPPKIESIAPVAVREGETVSLKPKASDPDSDKVSLTYHGWMTSDTYKTTFEDQGEHIVEVTASDGTDSSTIKVSIKVVDVNRPPVFTLQ